MKKAGFLLIFILLFLQIFVSSQVLKKSELARVYDESLRVIRGLELYRTMFLSPEIDTGEKLDYL